MTAADGPANTAGGSGTRRPLDPIERVVRTPRLQMHAVEWPGTLPAVLLLHPNRTSNRVWDFVVAASRLPNRFLAPALRGHGRSDWPDSGYRLEDHRDDLIALIETLRLGPVLLVGQATGATLALMIGSALPDRVRAVVAAQPAVGIAGTVNELVRTQVAAQRRLPDHAAARAALPFSERWSEAVVAHYLEHALMPAASGGFAWRYHAEGVCETEAQLMRALDAEIRYPGPALVFGGAQSTVLPQSMFDRVAALLPRSERTVLPGADHRLCQDNPAGFAALMDRFLREHG
ncbi:MAG: alpha/beta hydrolase [Burkholderiales bacterium]|nr:MAG: alpha/beta hydrolase [Burkholderiales bacterium]